MIKTILLLLLLLTVTQIQAQQINNELLQKKFELYRKVHPITGLFLHTDKTLYTNNEKIWFSAYLINPFPKMESNPFISVFLMRCDDRKVVTERKFKLVGRLSSGSILLPDTISPGSYQLVSYTSEIDKQGIPLATFSLPINIKNTTLQNFNASLAILDSIATNDTVRIKVTIQDKIATKKIKTQPVISYSIGKNWKRSIIIKGTELIISIPKEQITGQKPKLLTAISYGQQVQRLSITLPKPVTKKINVQFYPEGGNLLGGLPNLVGWEARTDEGMPIQISGQLLKDNKVIFQINSNQFGIGKFQLTPIAGSSYSLRISAGSYLKYDTMFVLPKIRLTQLGIHLNEAAINDTLMFSLYSLAIKPVQILVHNYRGDYLLAKVILKNSENKLKLPLQNMPRGLATLTVLDNQGQPLAERLLFCHYNDSTSLKLKADKSHYQKNDSVKIKLTLKDRVGNPLKGVFSAAVVQSSRLAQNFRDIETSVYLSQELGQLPANISGVNFRNKLYLEDILLIKGWRRYTWQDLVTVKPADTLQGLLPRIKGNIQLRGKSLKSPAELLVFGGTDVALIPTGTDGTFFLEPNQLITSGINKIRLAVNNSNKDYQIVIDDPYHLINNQLSSTLSIFEETKVLTNSSTDDRTIKGLQNMISLQSVVVKGSTYNGKLNGFKGEPGVNACGDYVDEYDYLNYEKSENRFKPISGKLYKKRTDLHGSYFKVEPVYYTGCTTGEKPQGFLIDGIYEGKEYYNHGTSISNFYGTTLYWRPGLTTNAAGEAEFSFVTNELSDNFRIIVQGITSNNLIYGTGEIKVN